MHQSASRTCTALHLLLPVNFPDVMMSAQLDARAAFAGHGAGMHLKEQLDLQQKSGFDVRGAGRVPLAVFEPLRCNRWANMERVAE